MLGRYFVRHNGVIAHVKINLAFTRGPDPRDLSPIVHAPRERAAT